MLESKEVTRPGEGATATRWRGQWPIRAGDLDIWPGKETIRAGQNFLYYLIFKLFLRYKVIIDNY